MDTKKKRFNWRINEELAARLVNARRESGFKSWQDFLQTVLNRWQQEGQQAPPPKSECGIRMEIEALNQRMGCFETKQELHLALAESNEEALQAIQQELKEALEIFRRMANLLNRALNEQTERPVSPLDQVRRRLPV